MNERERLIEKITSAKGYKVALFTSFNFSIDFFERSILGRLLDCNVKTVSLFVDANEFTHSLSELDISSFSGSLGKRYVVSPVYLQGAFHPKVALLLGEKKARLIVASANITLSGYEKNNEIYNVIDYSIQEPKYQDVIVAAIDFFRKINRFSARLDDQLMNEITDFVYFRKCADNGERYFITSHEKSIISQLRDIITDEVNEVRVAVPFFDDKAGAINSLIDAFPKARVDLFIQQGTSTFPAEYREKYHIQLFEKFDDSENGGYFYHGKVLLFKTKEKDYVLFGSANCTVNALIKTGITGGNIEADLLDIGEAGEFDGFFEKMCIISNEPLKSHISEKSIIECCPVRFISAEVSPDGIECKLQLISDTERPRFFIEDVQMEYSLTGNTIELFIDKEEAKKIKQLFVIKIECSSGSFETRCWILDRFSLCQNRNSTLDTDTPESYDPYAPGAKYRDVLIKWMNTEQAIFDNMEAYNRVKAIRQQKKMLLESGEDDDISDDSFIVEVELSYEDRINFRKYEYVENIRDRYLKWFFKPLEHTIERERAAIIRNNPEAVSSEVASGYTVDEDTRFTRFAKRRINDWIDEKNVKKTDAGHLIGLYRMLIGDIIDSKENGKGLVTSYKVETKISMVRMILSKDLTEIKDYEEPEEKVMIWAICIILQNYCLIKDTCDGDEKSRLNMLNRKFLLELEAKYSIRNRLKEFVVVAGDKNQSDDYSIIDEIGIGAAYTILDNMYGYKDKEQLIDFIKDKYGSNAQVDIKGNTIIISATVAKIMNYMKPDIVVINEVASFVENNRSEINELVIEMNNASKINISKIVNTISPLRSCRRCKSVTVYVNGTRDLPKYYNV